MYSVRFKVPRSRGQISFGFVVQRRPLPVLPCSKETVMKMWSGALPRQIFMSPCRWSKVSSRFCTPPRTAVWKTKQFWTAVSAQAKIEAEQNFKSRPMSAGKKTPAHSVSLDEHRWRISRLLQPFPNQTHVSHLRSEQYFCRLFLHKRTEVS